MIPGDLPDSRKQRCAFCLRSHFARDVFASPAFVVFPICKDCFTRARRLALLPERSAQIGLLAGLLDAGRPGDYRRMAEICISSSQADRAVFASRMAIREYRAEGDIEGEALTLALLKKHELASGAEIERGHSLDVERWLACEELPLRTEELILRGILWSDWFHRDLGAAKKYFELALDEPTNALAVDVRHQLSRLAKRDNRARLDRLRRVMGLKPLNGFLSRCAGCGTTNGLVFKNRFRWLSRLSLCAGCIQSIDRRTWSGDGWFRSPRQLPSDVFRD